MVDVEPVESRGELRSIYFACVTGQRNSSGFMSDLQLVWLIVWTGFLVLVWREKLFELDPIAYGHFSQF